MTSVHRIISMLFVKRLSLLKQGLMFVATVMMVCMPVVHAENIGSLGSLDISVEELRPLLASLEPAQLESVRQDSALLEQLVRSLLVQRLVLQEATTQKWQEQPAVVAKLARVRDSTITESYLESVAQPAADYPSDQELQEAYASNKEALKQPRSFRLAQIFIAEAPGAERKLSEIQGLLKKPSADFASLAQARSQETVSAARGGEIGWVTEAQIEPGLRDPVLKLKLFAVSEPIRLKDGWHFLKLLDAREPYVPTLEQVRVQMIRQLRQDRLRTNTQAYLARLLKEHPLVLNSSALSQLLPELPR